MRARKLLLAFAIFGVVLTASSGVAMAADKKLSFSSEECIKNVEKKDDPEAEIVEHTDPRRPLDD